MNANRHRQKCLGLPAIHQARHPLSAAIGSLLLAGSVQAATITVNSSLDGSVAGACTLRSAIAAANTNTAVDGCVAGSGVDQLVFAPSLSGSTITLTEGQIGIYSAMTIQGPGSGQLTIAGNGSSRLFRVAPPLYDSVAIRGVTLSGGVSDQFPGGSAIYLVVGGLELQDCVITANHAESPAWGGAVVATGFGHQLDLDNCVFSDNTLTTDEASPTSVAGAAVLSFQGNLAIQSSQFIDNQSMLAGGAVAAVFTQASINSSTFIGNQAALGGALLANQESSLSLSNSLISGAGLSTTQLGGGIFVTGDSLLEVSHSRITGHYSSIGGGIQVGLRSMAEALDEWNPLNEIVGSRGSPLIFYTGPAQLVMSNSRIDNNFAYFGGGGIAVTYGSIDLSDSQIDNNSSHIPDLSGLAPAGFVFYSLGGGVSLNGLLGSEMRNMVIRDNESTFGGGIVVLDDDLELYQSTISGNYALNGGGIQIGDPRADTPVGSGGSATIDEVMFANNSALQSGGGLSAARGSFVALKYSGFYGGQAESGGGASSIGTMFTRDTVFAQNSALIGGGLVAGGKYDCLVTSSRNSFADNSASVGGGMALLGCDGLVSGSTFHDNQADVSGGAIFARSVNEYTLLMVNSTVTNNQAGIGGGVVSDQWNANFVTVSHNTSLTPTGGDGPTENPGGVVIYRRGPSEISNSLISNNIGPDGALDFAALPPPKEDPFPFAAFFGALAPVAVDYTLLQNPGTWPGGGVGNLFGLDPKLEVLKNNGGTTLTRALPFNSPVVNQAEPAITTPAFDQRADPWPRVHGGRADMGAFEYFPDRIFADRFQ